MSSVWRVHRCVCATALLVVLALTALIFSEAACAIGRDASAVRGPFVRAGDAEADTTPPTTSVSGADAAWHNAPVTLTFSAIDNPGGSGVVTTEYQVDDGPWTAGTSVTIVAPGDHSNDGAHTVSYRSTDVAGNVEPTLMAAVLIDTQAPEVTARNGSDNREHTYGRVNYAIGEALSVEVTVRVAITDSTGAVVKELSSTREPGTALSTRFRCNLKPGTYRYRLQATDEAGNTGSARGTLTVYVWWRDAARYRGKTKTVLGPVKSTQYARASSGRPTFLNIGRPYPQRPRFTAVIWGRDRRAFPDAPEWLYADRLVTVRGAVTLYQGQPQIIVRRPAQIKILR